MAAPAMGYIICSLALVALIITMPLFFTIERNSVALEVSKRELTEISDYTSNTLANLFFLANSTNYEELTLTKQLLYLPQTIEGSLYTLRITSIGDNASKVTSSLKNSPQVIADSWLVPGLKVLDDKSFEITSKPMLAGCYRNSSGFYAWIGEA